MRQVLLGFVVVLWSSALFAQPSTDLRGPSPEVRTPQTPLKFPMLPSFASPPSPPGTIGAIELRVDGRKHLDTEVKVSGYIIWIYDCATAVARPGETTAQTKKRVAEDPTLCERPKFYLGQTPKDAIESGLWIVDVPRAPNKLERERLPKEELATWPKPPKLKVGDFVTVTGKFAQRSPHSESNSDGLVVFSAIAPAKKLPKTTVMVPAVGKARPAVLGPKITPVTVKPKDEASKKLSIKSSNEGTRAYGGRNFPDAIASYIKAITEWPGNHVAYYGLAGAHIGTKNWAPARDAMLKAVELSPSESMYYMVTGYVMYEAAFAEAREAEAKKQGRKPEEIVFDAGTVNHDKALSFLEQAIRLDAGLWRAHYYIGRIYRDRGEARWAAESFTNALKSAPTDPGPWVALVELYRRWYYTDDAIIVAELGTQHVPGDASDVWYVLGMAHDDKRNDADAIAAFTKALDRRPTHAKAVFQRGQAYFRKRDFANAKIDLEAFVKVAGSLEFAKQQASRMLMDIAAKKK